MATMKFGTLPPNAAAPSEAATPTTSAVEVYDSPKALVAASAPATQSNFVEGDFSSSDIQLPKLKLVQRTSDESLLGFGINSLVFDQAVKVGSPDSPAEVVVLRIRKNFRQNFPYGSQEIPATFDTVAALREAGLTIGNVKNGLTASEQGFIQLAVCCPDGASEEDQARFPFEFRGKHWAMALLIVGSSAYGTCFKPIFTATLPGQPLKDGLHKGSFLLHVEKKTSPQGPYGVPKPQFTGMLDEESVAFFAQMMGA